MSDIVRNLATELTTFEIVIGVVVSVLLGHLWLRAIENLFYNALGFPRDSFYVSLIIAVGMTLFFLVLILGLNEVARSVVLGEDDASTKTAQALTVSSSGTTVSTAPRCPNKEECSLQPRRRRCRR